MSEDIEAEMKLYHDMQIQKVFYSFCS